MMKFYRFLLFVFCVVVACQVQSAPFLTAQQMRDCLSIMPPPPAFEEAAFAYDQAQYEWGKSQRDSLRGKRAVEDAETNLSYISRIFSDAAGRTISAEKTPKTYALLYRLNETTKEMSSISKAVRFRDRPYIHFNEPTAVPQHEEDLRLSSSYPSGHTLLGWSMALVLTELFPQKSKEILTYGYEYGQSRVIVGFHYQSDVDTARMISSAIVALMHGEPDFIKMLNEAKEELK